MAKQTGSRIEAALDEQANLKGIVIQVSDDWRARWDGLQFNIERRTGSVKGKKAGGKEVWYAQAHCGTLDAAVYFLASRRLYGIKGVYGIEALDVLCKAIDEIKAETKALIPAMIAAQKELTDAADTAA